MNYVFSKINTYDKNKTSKFTIKIPELIKAYDLQGSKTTIYKTIKDSIENDLFNRTIKYWCENDNEYVKIHWLKKIKWKKEQSTSIEIEINDEIIDDLYELNKVEGGFTKIQFEKLAELNNYYSLKLFEVLESKRTQTKKNIIKISVEKLFKTLQLPESYERYCNMNARLLIPSAKKFKESKLIDFTFSNEKVNHGVDSFIRFYIHKKPNNNRSQNKQKESKQSVKIVPPKNHLRDKPKTQEERETAKKPKEIETAAPKNHLINKRTQEELDIARKGLEKLRAVL
jgi:hypothetical protein